MNEKTAKLNVILMADDDGDDQMLVKDAIKECGWEGDVVFVENGEELLKYLAKEGVPRPGLILLDLNMPRKDGREALKDIKANADLRRIPVVVLTTSKADTDVGTVYDLGANSFINKPVQFDALVNVMRRLQQYWFNTVELPATR